MADLTYTVPVPAHKVGTRVDRLLAEALPMISRSRVRALIENGRVRTESGAAMADPARRARAGDVYLVEVPPPKPAIPRPQPIPLNVVYEDDALVVIDKPAGLVVHPAAGNPDGTLVNALLAHCAGRLSGIGGVERPGIVHRLDKDTSGLLVVAKTDAAHASLSAQFAEHSVERSYRAVVWGVPRPPEGLVAGAIGRSASDRKRMAVVDRGGKPARTRYRVERRLGDVGSVLECRLETGRTHQIRVHLASIGHPVMGDPVYQGRRGTASRHVAARQAATRLGRQALHANVIGFSHPIDRRRCRFESVMPIEINQLVYFLESL